MRVSHCSEELSHCSCLCAVIALWKRSPRKLSPRKLAPPAPPGRGALSGGVRERTAAELSTCGPAKNPIAGCAALPTPSLDKAPASQSCFLTQCIARDKNRQGQWPRPPGTSPGHSRRGAPEGLLTFHIPPSSSRYRSTCFSSQHASATLGRQPRSAASLGLPAAPAPQGTERAGGTSSPRPLRGSMGPFATSRASGQPRLPQ